MAVVVVVERLFRLLTTHSFDSRLYLPLLLSSRRLSPKYEYIWLVKQIINFNYDIFCIKLLNMLKK